MPPLEAWEKVYIDPAVYAEDIHAFINCTTCHAGEAVGSMEAAHTGLVADPSADAELTCGTCHPDITPHATESLHGTLEGYDVVLHQRSSEINWETLEEMESYHCDSCHATCGDCHISQPNSVGGGLLDGHAFVEKPPMGQTCTACHGSRVKNEYYGLNEGYTGDVHLRQARLACTDCHTAEEMHGQGEFANATHRYDAPAEPECEDCHADQVGAGSGIPEHEIHGTEILSCQVCHSVAYTNCVNCHVDRTEDDIPYYSVEEHSLQFMIGRNVNRSPERPYRYVTVRHVPIDVNSFSAYGENLLDNFLNRPTWAMATPHNIQRNTPQTETCFACHGNDAIFLTADKVAPGELEANLGVIVDQAPPVPSTYGQFQQYLDPSSPSSVGSTGDDFWGESPVGDGGAAEGENPSYWQTVGPPPTEVPLTATPEATVEPTTSAPAEREEE
ncbi:MAG: hypothetical protein JW910_16015 [Anaerolineae bacterium]|nr:hypothetical protein [Anaerolineae bacterium]